LEVRPYERLLVLLCVVCMRTFVERSKEENSRLHTAWTCLSDCLSAGLSVCLYTHTHTHTHLTHLTHLTRNKNGEPHRTQMYRTSRSLLGSWHLSSQCTTSSFRSCSSPITLAPRHPPAAFPEFPLTCSISHTRLRRWYRSRAEMLSSRPSLFPASAGKCFSGSSCMQDDAQDATQNDMERERRRPKKKGTRDSLLRQFYLMVHPDLFHGRMEVVCVCVCVWVGSEYVCICMCTCICICARAFSLGLTQLTLQTRTCTHTYIHTHSHTHTLSLSRFLTAFPEEQACNESALQQLNSFIDYHRQRIADRKQKQKRKPMPLSGVPPPRSQTIAFFVPADVSDSHCVNVDGESDCGDMRKVSLTLRFTGRNHAVVSSQRLLSQVCSV
jgi:hypothetical protein